MQVKAARRGIRAEETPVRYRRRIGRSKISGTVSGSVRAGVAILGTIAAEALRGGRLEPPGSDPVVFRHLATEPPEPETNPSRRPVARGRFERGRIHAAPALPARYEPPGWGDVQGVPASAPPVAAHGTVGGEDPVAVAARTALDGDPRWPVPDFFGEPNAFAEPTVATEPSERSTHAGRAGRGDRDVDRRRRSGRRPGGGDRPERPHRAIGTDLCVAVTDPGAASPTTAPPACRRPSASTSRAAPRRWSRRDTRRRSWRWRWRRSPAAQRGAAVVGAGVVGAAVVAGAVVGAVAGAGAPRSVRTTPGMSRPAPADRPGLRRRPSRARRRAWPRACGPGTASPRRRDGR